MKISTTILESSMELLQETKDRTVSYDPVIPLLGIYPKERKTGYSRCTCTTMFIAVLFIFIIAKLLWKEPRCPTTDEWGKKM
jgi:hypothetical protein